MLYNPSGFMICETYNNSEFPVLQTICYDELFKEKIAYFYFHLTRKDLPNVLELSKNLTDTLLLLKKQMTIQGKTYTLISYLELFYRMIGQTRDILFGKGEQELAFMMIFCFYEVFPTLAIFAVHRFVQPVDKLVPYGSWRDIKYLCEYIRLHSKKRENHELINICIRLMNSQLKKDLETWKFSVFAGSRKHISNIAKWIPREKKKFGWLFDMLVIDWMKTNMPHYFNNISDSWIPAFVKSKGIYRKKIAGLNKSLDTTEIKQCSQKLDELNPSSVSCYTTLKQPWLLRQDSFKKYFESSESFSDETSNFYPVSIFIKRAISLIGSPIDSYDSQLLNKQWIWFSNTISKVGFGKTLPVIDVSFSMQQNDSDAFYYAIGYAILIAERSSFGEKIMAVDHQATWINLESCSSFVNMVETVFIELKSKSNTNMNLSDALDTIRLAITLTKCSKRFVDKITLIFVSDFSNSTVRFPVRFPVRFQNIVFWNVGKYKIGELPCGIRDKTLIYSGIGNGVLKGLPKLLENLKIGDKCTMFKNISSILKNSRYDILGNYLRNLQK